MTEPEGHGTIKPIFLDTTYVTREIKLQGMKLKDAIQLRIPSKPEEPMPTKDSQIETDKPLLITKVTFT